MAKRFKFTVVFEGDLDSFPGAAHNEADWHAIAIDHFMRQTHYNVSATIVESTDTRGVFGGWGSMQGGWIEIEDPNVSRALLKPDDLDPDEMVQVKTPAYPNSYPIWIAAREFWPSKRNGDDRITAYRRTKAAHDKIADSKVEEAWNKTQAEMRAGKPFQHDDADDGSHYAFCEQSK